MRRRASHPRAAARPLFLAAMLVLLLLAAGAHAWSIPASPPGRHVLTRGTRACPASTRPWAPGPPAGSLQLRRWASADGGEDGDDEEEGGEQLEPLESMLKGKQRRALRALAGRKKNDKSLFTMQQSEEKPSERFLKEVASALRAHELVNVRVLFAQKKKEAKAVGTAMARGAGAELVQVIGHTYLLYKPGDPPKIDLEGLTGPAEGG